MENLLTVWQTSSAVHPVLQGPAGVSLANGRSSIDRLLSRFEALPVRWQVVSLAALTWLPLIVLSAAGGSAAGTTVRLPLLRDFVVAVRFLVAMPILLAAEPVIRTQVNDFCRYLVDSGLVKESAVPAFERLAARFARLRDSTVAALITTIVVVFSTAFFRLEFSGDASSWQFVAGPSGLSRSVAGWWHLLISVPIFQFLLLHWVWRYGVWCWFLFRISRSDLVLNPTHPDRAAGLMLVGYVHQYFGMIVLALSSIVCAHIGLELVERVRVLSDYRIYLGSFLAVSLVFLLGPLLVFTPRLVAIRRRGLLEYGSLAADYTRAFKSKWIHRTAPASEPLLGSSDIQSLADLANSYSVVQQMRIVPFEWRTIMSIVLSVVAPALPLAFAAFSPVDVLKGLAQVLL